MHSLKAGTPALVSGTKAATQVPDRPGLRLGSSHCQLPHRGQLGSSHASGVFFVDANDEGSVAIVPPRIPSVGHDTISSYHSHGLSAPKQAAEAVPSHASSSTTSLSGWITEITTSTQDSVSATADSYPFSLRHAGFSEPTEEREDPPRRSSYRASRLPSIFPMPDMPPPSKPGDFKTNFMRLRKRPGYLSEPSIVSQPTDLSNDLQDCPEETCEHDELSFHHEHTFFLDERASQLASQEVDTTYDPPTPSPHLFHHEHSILDDEGPKRIKLQRTHTNMDYAFKMREPLDTSGRSRRLVNVPIRKLRKVFQSVAL